MDILYVEDDPFDADLTRRALAKTAPYFSLKVARTQSEAMQYLQGEADFDLMLTDLRLPDGSGFKLLSHVRELRLPMAVVVITGQGDEEIAVSVLKAGANDYIVKRQDYLDRLAFTLESARRRYLAEVARRERPLRVLYLENNPADIDLARRHFSSHAPHIHLDIVHSPNEILRRLPVEGKSMEYDTILLDYSLHDLNALDLLKEVRQGYNLDLPVVLVTDQGDDEVAAQSLRLGASDYVVKSPGYLYRLPGLIENAYHRAQLLREQAALRASEERFRRLAENAPDIIYRYRVSPEPAMEYLSPAVFILTGFTPQELYTDLDLCFSCLHPDDRELTRERFQNNPTHPTPISLRFIRKDGKIIWIETRNVPIFDNDGCLIAHEGIARDITERKQAEEHIQRQLQRLNALQAVDTAITASLDLGITLNVLLEHVVAQLNVDAANILLYNPHIQLFEYSAGVGFRSSDIKKVSLRLGESYAGKAAQKRCTVHAAGQITISEQDNFQNLLAGEGFSTYYGTPLIAKGQVKGVLEVYHRQPLDADSEWLGFYETLAGQAAIAIDNAELFENLQRANLELTMAYDTTLEGWVRALDLRDNETQGHTQRVTEITIQLARSMGAGDGSLQHIRRGALLHDIGKMAIPDNILHKPGPLTDEEWAIMRKHPIHAYELLSPIDYLRPALDIPYCHHEWWDGRGYPRQLKGEQIPLAARIFAVVDVWDALSNNRPYRNQWEQAHVLDHIRSRSGTHFDPRVVEKFLGLLQEQGLI